MTDNFGTAPPPPPPKASGARPLLFILLLVALMVLVRTFHLEEYVEEQRLRTFIASYGFWGPLVYLGVWTVAPALLLPGLPITLTGGVLFGPVWGVVYTAFGAPAGATLAFLVARYLARDWVAAKIRHTRLAHLDDRVARHGWKIVAFTRLIPVFPFFLLNYAFGLTRISLTAYVLATFFGMIPGTIAYVYFSSHLLDLIRGKISRGLVIGVILVVIVTLIPMLYRRLKGKKGEMLEP